VTELSMYTLFIYLFISCTLLFKHLIILEAIQLKTIYLHGICIEFDIISDKEIM
jgi:hypothetical protein